MSVMKNQGATKGSWNSLGLHVVLIVVFLFKPESVHARGTCRIGEFRCETGECISKSQVCDSIRDCPSGIDEYVCTPKFRRGFCGITRPRYRTHKGVLGELGQTVVSFLLGSGPKKGSIFQCQYGGCIPIHRLCDGSINCIGGSDESEICENNSCLPGQFQCKYGACIPDWQMCNGRVNCPDGSDETPEACKYITCRKDEFRCRYGGCIPKTRICDIKKHCADGSDEYDFLCLITRAKMVHTWEQEAKQIDEEQDKRILAEFEKRKNENSVTDKSYLTASSTSYPPTYSTTTTTTTQIPRVKPSTVSQESLDNTIQTNYETTKSSTTRQPEVSTEISMSMSVSNETGRTRVDVSKSSTSNPKPLAESLQVTPEPPQDPIMFTVAETKSEITDIVKCVLPAVPENIESVSVTNCYDAAAELSQLRIPQTTCNTNTGESVPPDTYISYECEAGFILFGPPSITCKTDGKWSAKPPDCLPNIDVRWGFGSTLPNNFDRRCPALSPPQGVVVECIDPKDIEVKSCFEKQAPGTAARYSCAPYYKPTGDLPTLTEKCDEDGKWTPGVYKQFTCLPDCGISEVPKTAYIHNGQSTKRGQWPWHAAIYLIHKGELKYLCGGALITEQAVLTSAHCVTVRNAQRDPGDLIIMLGKQNRGVPDPDPFVQKRRVSHIYVKDSFNYRSLESDIAIIALKEAAVLTFYVRPVCYPQTSNSFLEEYQLSAGNLGTVVGFGLTETGNYSESLRMAELPVVSSTECTDSGGDFFASMTRSTSYCAGYQNGTQVCNGDSGGGHYFKARSRGSTRWYIQGLVSYGVPDSDTRTCVTSQYAIFTRVGRYGDWIVRTLSAERLLGR